MKVLLKPIRNEENLLAKGYCDLNDCLKSFCDVVGDGIISTMDDQVNSDDEILF